MEDAIASNGRVDRGVRAPFTDTEMAFDEFWHSQPFGWAGCDANTLARTVWDAAKMSEREACAKACREFGKTLEVDIGDSFSEEIMARSNAKG